ncbi:MAG: hypothetical protein WC612_01740 [Bdellovibrionales bacterium]|jgi:hypothetical protein
MEKNFPWTPLCKTVLMAAYEKPDWLNAHFLACAKEGDVWGLRRAYSAGANLGARDQFGNTAAILAGANGRAKAIMALHHWGADLAARNDFTLSAADLAYARGQGGGPLVLKVCGGHRPTL